MLIFIFTYTNVYVHIHIHIHVHIHNYAVTFVLSAPGLSNVMTIASHIDTSKRAKTDKKDN
jgi:hypothetical protein